jgi:hypothetical protein
VSIMVVPITPQPMSQYTTPIVVCIVTLAVGTTIWWVFIINARDALAARNARNARDARILDGSNMCSLERDRRHYVFA